MSKSFLGRAVIECGRGHGYGSGKTERKQRILEPDVEGEPFPPQARYTRELRDNLRPLERWLKAHANRGWNKTYAEFCEREDKRTLRGDHIHRHLKEMVLGSGGREGAALGYYNPKWHPPCQAWHGFWRFWIDRYGILRHHDRHDCERYGRKVGWEPNVYQLRVRPYVPLDALKRALETGKITLYSLRNTYLLRMDERDKANPGWWLSPITAARLLDA